MSVLVIDVGNTSACATLYESHENSEPLWTQRHSWRGDQAVVGRREFLQVLQERPIDRWVVGSVSREGTAMVEELRSEGRTVRAFLRGTDFPMAANVQSLEAVGVDRLAACLAAYSEARTACVVVDVGTAITVDLVDGTGCFQGGAIVPGRQAYLNGLAQATDQLPRLVVDPSSPRHHLPGKNTEEAILHGLDVGLPALVEALIADLERDPAHHPQRWVTGGDAAWFLDRSVLELQHQPGLVSLGLLWADRRCSEES